MPVSTSTVFHFTRSSENLINILTNNFRPHFCIEDFTVVMPDLKHKDDLVFAIPMVSFCDIPLSQISPHLEHYGSYGIGLSKNWAMRSGLAPVLYIVRGSPLASTLHSIVSQLSTFPRDQLGNSTALNYFHDLSSYLKPYEGASPNDTTGTIRRFYDEREWRFVPNLNSLPFRYGLAIDEFYDKDKLEKVHQFLWKRSVMAFTPSDIKYIIVERENEILDMISKIAQIKERFPSDQVKMLSSRIISSRQIREDF